MYRIVQVPRKAGLKSRIRKLWVEQTNRSPRNRAPEALHSVARWNTVTRTIVPSTTRNKTSSEPSPRPPEKLKYLSKKSTDFVPKKAARNGTGRSRYGPKFNPQVHG